MPADASLLYEVYEAVEQLAEIVAACRESLERITDSISSTEDALEAVDGALGDWSRAATERMRENGVFESKREVADKRKEIRADLARLYGEAAEALARTPGGLADAQRLFEDVEGVLEGWADELSGLEEEAQEAQAEIENALQA